MERNIRSCSSPLGDKIDTLYIHVYRKLSLFKNEKGLLEVKVPGSK